MAETESTPDYIFSMTLGCVDNLNMVINIYQRAGEQYSLELFFSSTASTELYAR